MYGFERAGLKNAKKYWHLYYSRTHAAKNKNTKKQV